MKKIAVSIFFATISLVLAGQGKPNWLDEEFRQMKYPENVFITGFARSDLNDGKTLDDAIQQAKTEAQADLSRKIRVQITSRITTETTAVSADGQYRETESLTGSTTVESDIELVGLYTESYYDPARRMAYAFAVVKRDEVAGFYRRMIHQELNEAENILSIAKEIAAAGKRMNARSKAVEAKIILNGVRSYRYWLAAVDSQPYEGEREKSLQRTVEQLLTDLKQIASVYLDCRYENSGGKDDAFGSDPGILRDIIAQALSENDCSVTENRGEADYELTLVTSTTQRSDGTGQYGVLSYYANVNGSLFNRATGQKVVDFAIFNNPAAYATGRSPEDAATKAFKQPELKEKIMEMVLSKIQ